MVFLIGAAVEDSQPLAPLLPGRELLGADPRRAVFVLDDFGEGFARHMDAAIDGEPRRLPRPDAADEHRDISISALDQPRRRALGEALAVVADDDRHGAARQQPRRDQLQPGERQAGSHQEMPVVKAALLARVDDRDLAG